MSIFYKILYWLQGNMNTPVAFGWFHCLCLLLVVIVLLILFILRNYHNEKQLKIILGVYGIIALILELSKQLIWAFSYDPMANIITWDYEWYAFPFQLCTTPIYVCLICLFLKKGKSRDSLLSYMAYITILGSIATMIMPESCFVEDTLVNIHTMWLHLGSFVVSIYLLISREVELKLNNFKSAVWVFLIFVIIAIFINLIIYNVDILNGETFNMFYISPYFISTLPIFDIIQQHVPYIVYLVIYICALILGGFIIFSISLLINKVWKIKKEYFIIKFSNKMK